MQKTIRVAVSCAPRLVQAEGQWQNGWELNVMLTNLVRDGNRPFRVRAIAIGLSPGARFVATNPGEWVGDDAFAGFPDDDDDRVLQVTLVRRGRSQASAWQRLEIQVWRERDGVQGFTRAPDVVITYQFRLRH